MATREELMRQFMLDQKNVIKDNEEREQRKSSSGKKFSTESGTKTINLVIPKGETMREYKGYFVTDPNDRFTRRVSNIRMTGCSYKAYKTVGLRTMDLSSYSDKLDQESKDLIIRFNNLWDKMASYPEAVQKEATKIQDENGAWINDPKFFVRKYNNFDLCYMYLLEGPGVEEPGYYLIQSKSLEFVNEKAKMVNKQVKFMKENAIDPTMFVVEMSDNTAPKKRLITFKVTRPTNGYKFDFDTEMQQNEFILPASGLNELKPLSDMYISENEIDKEAYKTNINILATWISKIESQTQRAAAVQTVEVANDPFAD